GVAGNDLHTRQVRWQRQRLAQVESASGEQQHEQRGQCEVEGASGHRRSLYDAGIRGKPARLHAATTLTSCPGTTITLRTASPSSARASPGSASARASI